MQTKICEKCCKAHPLDQFTSARGKQCLECRKAKKRQLKRAWEKRSPDHKQKRRAKLKATMPLRAFEYMGGKCANPDCPLPDRDWPLSIYEYHHRDPETKEFGIATAIHGRRGWTALQKELDKCVMLCCVCHRTLHAGLWELKKGP